MPSILTNPQGNRLLAILHAANVPRHDLAMDEMTHEYHQLQRILHTPSSRFFALGPGTVQGEFGEPLSRWLILCSPGFDRQVASYVARDWDEAFAVFQDWLGVFLQEIRQPDLWAELGQEPSLREAATMEEPDNSPFREAEKPIVRSAVEEIKDFIQDQHDVTQDKLDFAIKRLMRLEEAVERLGRFDWREQLFGVLTQIGLGLAMDSATFKAMWALALNKLRGVLALPAA